MQHCVFNSHVTSTAYPVGRKLSEADILSDVESWRTYLAYGFAHFGKSLFWYSSELLFAYFLTELAGLTPTEMGVVLATGFLASAFIDILAGIGLKRRLTTARSAGDTQLAGAILSSIALLLVFVSSWLPDHIQFVYSLLAGLAFRIGFAFYDIPQNALMALAPTSSASRMRFAATRILFSGLATLVIAATVGLLVAAQAERRGSYFLLTIASLFAVMAISGAWHFARLLRGVWPGSDTVSLSRWTAPSKLPPFQRDFWLLLCLMFVTSCFTPVFSKVEPYFVAYVLRSPLWGGSVIMSMAMGILLGQPFWLSASGRASPERVMFWAALLQLIGLLAFWLSSSSHPVALTLSAFVFGLGNGGVGMMLWGSFSGTVARMGSRYAAISYGVFTAVSKVANAGGILLLGFVLARIDFRQSDALQMVVLMTAVPAVGAILIMLIGVGLSSRKSSSGSPAGHA